MGCLTGRVQIDRQPDLERIISWLQLLIAPDQIAELRAIYKNGRVCTGYYHYDHLADMATAAMDLGETRGIKGVYVTLNALKPELLERADLRNQVRSVNRGDCASQADVIRRRWLLIDADPKRPPHGQGSAATDSEKATSTLYRNSLADAG